MKKKLIVSFLVWALVGVPLLGRAQAEEQSPPPSLLKTTLQRIIIGEPRSHKGLSIFPLLVAEPTKQGMFATLDPSVSSGKLSVSEWGTGSVPKLRVVNRSHAKVFIMAGEIMTGAKQDRMSAHDVILDSIATAVALPVYCVEQGRWANSSSQFSSGRTAGTKKLRRSAVNKEAQGKIWNDVAEKSHQSGVESATGTMQAVYHHPRIRDLISDYTQVMGDLPKQVHGMIGFVAVVNGEMSSADLFRDPSLFESLWHKLLKASATDAETHKGTSMGIPSKEEVGRFLSDGMNGRLTKTPNPGLGMEYLIEGKNGVSGSVLFYEKSIVHLALFGPEKNDLKRTLVDQTTPDIQQANIPVGIDQTTRPLGTESRP